MKDQDKPLPAGDKDETTTSRRKLLTALASGTTATAAGSMMPREWTRPLLNTTLLPAHAQTSLSDPCNVTISSFAGGNISANVTGFVSGGGNLGGLTINVSGELTQNGNLTGTTDQRNTFTNPDGSYATALSFPGGCSTALGTPNGILVTVTSPDFPGQAICSTGFSKGSCR